MPDPSDIPSIFDITQLIITFLGALLASSGFWIFVQKRGDRKTRTTQLLLGLAHDRILYLGMKYIDRGWISKDEYEDFVTYLYQPYSEFGGNGLAERIMQEVARLPIRNVNPLLGVNKKEKENDRRYYEHDLAEESDE